MAKVLEAEALAAVAAAAPGAAAAADERVGLEGWAFSSPPSGDLRVRLPGTVFDDQVLMCVKIKLALEYQEVAILRITDSRSAVTSIFTEIKS